MQLLNLPKYSFRIKKFSEGRYIFDNIRKKFVVLTPEEWVRQHITHFVINELSCPKGRIAVEYFFKVGLVEARADVLIFDEKGDPLLLIECKAASVSLNQKTFDQISTYNTQLATKFVLATNGLKHIPAYYSLEQKRFVFLKQIPSYEQMIHFIHE